MDLTYKLLQDEVTSYLRSTKKFRHSIIRMIIESIIVAIFVTLFIVTWLIRNDLTAIIFAIITFILLAFIWVVPTVSMIIKASEFVKDEITAKFTESGIDLTSNKEVSSDSSKSVSYNYSDLEFSEIDKVFIINTKDGDILIPKRILSSENLSFFQTRVLS